MQSEIVHVGPTIPHHTYLGGSDIGAVLGLSPYKTALTVWAQKTGRAPPFDNARTRSGNRFERVILENYAEDHGAKLTFPGSIRHANGITGCTPDAIANGKRDVQVKMVGYHEAQRWGAVDLREDGIPAEVLAQIHWEWWHLEEILGVRDDVIHVAAQFGTEPRVYEITAERSFAEDMIDAGMRFWHDHIITDRMPVVSEKDGDMLRHLYRKAGGAYSEMTDEVEALLREYRAHTESEGKAKKAKELLAAKLMDATRDGLGFLGRGLKFTWREQRGRIDWEACARAFGATDTDGEKHRGENVRVIDVRELKKG